MKKLLFSVFALLLLCGCELSDINFNHKVDSCKNDCKTATILNLNNCMGNELCMEAALIQHEWCRDSCEASR